MRINKISAGVIGSAMTLLAAVPINVQAATRIGGAINDHVPLATAYNSLTGEFLNFQTVQGQVKAGGNGEASIKSYVDMSYSEISSRLSGDVTINADFPVVKAEAGADIALSTASDEFSANWVLSVINKSVSEVLRDIDGIAGLRLSSQGATIAAQGLTDSQLLNAAGDEYVTEIEYSTQLFVSMKVDYLSTADKLDINGHISVDFAAGEVSGTLGYLTDEQKSSVNITVQAHQFGGDPLQLLTILPDNIITCTLINFTPCEELFETAIKYARGLDQYAGNGFKDQQVVLSNANVVGYTTEPYSENFYTNGLVPSTPYIKDNNTIITKNLQDEYVDQLKAHNRASTLLTKSLPYLSTIQRAALRSTAKVALNNAEALRDLVNFCDANVYGGACAANIAAECPVDGSSRTCITEYSTELFDVANLNALEQMQQQYAQLVAPATVDSLGLDLLQLPDVSSYPKSGSVGLIYNKSTGKVTGMEGIVFNSPSEVTADFMVKASKKLTTAKLHLMGAIGSFQVSVYKDDEWQVTQDSSTTVDQSIIDGAQAVDGYYYYHFDVQNTTFPIFELSRLNTGDNIDLYFYQKQTHITPMTTGFNRDNIPFYFTSRNIEIAKDINNNDIGYCPDAGNTLTRASGTDYCRKYGRVYNWADAAKACEAYSEQHEAESGLLFRLPTRADYQDLVSVVEQQAGVGQAAYWLKSYQFKLYNGVHNTNNKLGFNVQGGGVSITGYTTSNAPFYYQDEKASLWTATPNGNSSYIVSFYDHNNYVSFGTSIQPVSIKNVRCIGTYTK